jgi:hypothetical protein
MDDPGSDAAGLNGEFFTSLRGPHGSIFRDFLGRTIAQQLLDENIPGFGTELVQWCIDAQSVNVQDRLGRTLLHLLCQRNSMKGVELALEAGADPGATTIYGHLPLHYAAAGGCYYVCTMLLQHWDRFGVHQCDNLGWSARNHADINKHASIVELLNEANHRESDVSDESDESSW